LLRTAAGGRLRPGTRGFWKLSDVESEIAASKTARSGQQFERQDFLPGTGRSPTTTMQHRA
jgi:hypothetical protein